MRSSITFFLALFVLCSAARSQLRNENGHFDNWPAEQAWGTGKLVLDATGGIGDRPLALTVSMAGFNLRDRYVSGVPEPIAWSVIEAWCSSENEMLMLMKDDIGGPPVFMPGRLTTFRSEELAPVVETYWRVYAKDQEVSRPGVSCSRQLFQDPDRDANMTEIIELLETAQ